jgi:hypothetical protein
MQHVEETQQTLAHTQKIKDTQNELERKVKELQKEEDGLKKDNIQLKQQIK